MEKGKILTSDRRKRVREFFTTEARRSRHEEQIVDAQPEAMRYFAESMWGPEQKEDKSKNWQFFKEIKGFTVGLGITNGTDYFIACPPNKLDLTIDWSFHRPPMSRLYVEKRGEIDEITGIAGFSGPIFTIEELGNGVENRNRTIFWENPISDQTAA